MANPGLPLATVALVAFVTPLLWAGELTVWTFDEPVSNLEWDEAGMRPQQSGGGGGATGGGGGGGGGSGGGTGGGGGGSGGDTGGGGGSGGGGGDTGGGGGSGDADTGGGSGGSGDTETGGSGTVEGSGSGSGDMDGGGGSGPGEGSAPQGSFSFDWDWGFWFWGMGWFVAMLALMMAVFAQAMMAFWLATLAWLQFMAWWVYGLVGALLLFVLYLWATFGVYGGILTAGGVGLMVWLHANGHLYLGPSD